jgi:transposase
MNMHPQGGVANRDQQPNAGVDVCKRHLDVCLGTTDQRVVNDANGWDELKLGSLGRRQISKLVGEAPLADDSGARKGKHRIWSGRANVRAVVYVAALVATRHNQAIRVFSTATSVFRSAAFHLATTRDARVSSARFAAAGRLLRSR